MDCYNVGIGTAKKFPKDSPSFEDGFSWSSSVPNKDKDNPVITFSFGFSPLSNSKMIVKRGARQPRRVAEAISVSLIAAKKVAK